MLKKTITYINPFTNEEVTEDHYFHLTKADLIEMQAARPGGMEEHLKRIIANEDNKVILEEFKNMLQRAYGKKVGDRFIKSEEAWNEFVSSEAYSNLLFEFFTDVDAASTFMNGIIPNDLDAATAQIAAAQARLSAEDAPAQKSEPRILTREEAREMDSDELHSGIASGRYRLS